MKFRDHKYTWEHPFECAKHRWSFRGPGGGLHLDVSIMDDEKQFPHPSAGLEYHHNRQPCGEPGAAHHSQCWLTGQPCWHEGISSYANETVWPHVEQYLQDGDHPGIFRYLEGLYDDHFARLRGE